MIHWHLLNEDPILRKYVGQHPEVVFRWGNPLRDKLVSSHYSQTSTPPRQSRGIHMCGKCSFCLQICPGNSFLFSNGKHFTSRFFANCGTRGIVYLMLCRCGVFYVGNPARQFRKRINHHICYSANGKMPTTVSRHLDLYHKFDTSYASFISLTVVPSDTRGGNWDKKFYKRRLCGLNA